MTSIRVCSAAEMEYTQSLLWYAERSQQVARDFDAEFDAALRQIAKNPQRYPSAETTTASI